MIGVSKPSLSSAAAPTASSSTLRIRVRLASSSVTRVPSSSLLVAVVRVRLAAVPRSEPPDRARAALDRQHARGRPDRPADGSGSVDQPIVLVTAPALLVPSRRTVPLVTTITVAGGSTPACVTTSRPRQPGSEPGGGQLLGRGRRPSSRAAGRRAAAAAGTSRPAGPAARPRGRSPRRRRRARAGPDPPRPGRARRSPGPARAGRRTRPGTSTRRASGSSSVTVRSGRASASGMPGSPAPLPTSTTRAPAAPATAIAAELSRCRSHSRGTSRGPISPRTAPSVASSRAYSTAASTAGPKTARAVRRYGRLECPQWTLMDPPVSPGRTTTRRSGSSPSDSLRTPSIAAIASCTTLRSNGFIASSRTGDAGRRDLGRRVPGDLGQRRPPPGPVAADVEHQPAAQPGLLLHGEPGQLLQRVEGRRRWARPDPAGPSPTTATTARSPSTSRSMSPS